MCGTVESKDKKADLMDALADTVMILLEEDRLTIGQGFDLLRRIERRLQDKAYAQKI